VSDIRERAEARYINRGKRKCVILSKGRKGRIGGWKGWIGIERGGVEKGKGEVIKKMKK